MHSYHNVAELRLIRGIFRPAQSHALAVENPLEPEDQLPVRYT
jgi:hypothetical protein